VVKRVDPGRAFLFSHVLIYCNNSISITVQKFFKYRFLTEFDLFDSLRKMGYLQSADTWLQGICTVD